VGHRLTKIYTRTGDGGETGLGDGRRVAKDSPRIEAIGTVDELNSMIGLLLAEVPEQNIIQRLLPIQHHLFDIGAELSMPSYSGINETHVFELEQTLDSLNAELPPLKEFVLPGGTRVAAVCHLARAICRRAERRVLGLMHVEEVRAELLRYLNRLADLLFVVARVLARQEGAQEVYWQAQRTRPDPTE
jgi:cob(I)alamin adenosyltransferase